MTIKIKLCIKGFIYTASLFYFSIVTTLASDVVLDEVKTNQGIIKIVRSTRGGAEWNSVVLAGQVIYKGVDEIISFDGNYNLSRSNTKLLLLGFSSQGVSCPNLYRVITIDAPKKPVITREFGNCAVAKSSFSQNTLEIRFPKFQSNSGVFVSEEIWWFKNGKLIKSR